MHEDYINAGADVITVNNFPVTPWSLGRIGREDAFVALTQAGVSARIASVWRFFFSSLHLHEEGFRKKKQSSCCLNVQASDMPTPPPRQQAAANIARNAVDSRSSNDGSGGGSGGQRRSVRVAGSLPPLGESYSTAGGQRAAEIAQPVYAQVRINDADSKAFPVIDGEGELAPLGTRYSTAGGQRSWHSLLIPGSVLRRDTQAV